MTSPDLKRIVEALLFAADVPVPLDKLLEIIGDASRADVGAAATESTMPSRNGFGAARSWVLGPAEAGLSSATPVVAVNGTSSDSKSR